jgi:predicted transcriptional regulator
MRKTISELDKGDSRISEQTVLLLEVVHNDAAETLNEMSAFLSDKEPAESFRHVNRLVEMGLLETEANGWQQTVKLTAAGETVLRERYVE